MDYEKALIALRKYKLTTDERGLSYKIKYIPENRKENIIDPRQEEVVINSLKESSFNIKDQKNPTNEELIYIRNLFAKKNKDLSNNIITKVISVDDIKVELYQSESFDKEMPCVFYIHGGGFIGGGIDTVRNPCKLLCERSQSIVVSIDYSLSPEYPFPVAINQCYKIIKHFVNQNSKYNIDKDKVIVMGDSAGGNIAAACCLLDTEKIIKLQVLLYPVVDVNPACEDWNESYYGQSNNEKISSILINQVKDLMDLFTYSYLKNNESFENELISPLFAKDYSNFPLTLIVSPEYDYLRIQDEEFAHRLVDNGIDVIVLRYKGMGHAFLEKFRRISTSRRLYK